MRVVCVYLSLIVAVSVSAMPERQFNLLVKEMEHTTVVQGKPAAAAEQCLATLKKESLSTNQASRLQKLLKISALESNNNELIRKVVDYCTVKNIRCDALRQKIGFASAEERNLQGDRIREALEYQWHNLQWEKNNPDYSVFKDYLQDNLCNNTDISETARIQAAIFLTSLDWWRNSDIRDTLGLTSNIVIRNYELLLKDVYHSNGNNPMVEYTAVLNRLLSIAKEYVIQEQPLLVSSIRNKIIIYSYKISKEKKTSDLFRVLAHKLGIYSAEEIRSAFKGQLNNTQKYIPITVIIYNHPNDPNRFRIKINKLFPAWINISLSNDYDIPYQYQPLTKQYKPLSSFFIATNNLPDSLNSAFSLSGTNKLNNIEYSNAQLLWNTTNVVTSVSRRSRVSTTNYANAAISETTITGYCNKVEWYSNLSKISNAIWSIEEPLNEIRKYVMSQKEEKEQATTEAQQSQTELWLEFTNNWTVFVKQGPTNGAQALPALDKAIDICKKIVSGHHYNPRKFNPDKLGFFQDFRKKYNSDFSSAYEYIFKRRNQPYFQFQPINQARWCAAYLLPKVTELETMLEKTRDPVLQKQFAYKFYRQYKGFFSTIAPELSPAYSFLEHAVDRHFPATVLQPLITIIKNRLQEMLDHDQSYISPLYYAEMIDRCMPVFAACPQYCDSIISRKAPTKDNWQLQARIDSAVTRLHETPQFTAINIVKVLTGLVRGIREDEGVSTKTTDWVKKLGLTVPQKSKEEIILAEFLSDLSVYINGIITNSPKSLAARTRLAALLSNSTIRCHTEPSSSEEFKIFINRYPDERLRNSQFKELNVKAGNLQTNLTLNLMLGNNRWVLHNYQSQLARLIDVTSQSKDDELQKEYVNQFRSTILQHEINIRYPSLHIFDYLLYDTHSPALLSALFQRVNTLIQEYTDELNKTADFADGFELTIPLTYSPYDDTAAKSKQRKLFQKIIRMAHATLQTQSDWRRKGYIEAAYGKLSNPKLTDRECLQILTDFIVWLRQEAGVSTNGVNLFEAVAALTPAPQNDIIGNYVFSVNSKNAGKKLDIIAEAGSLFVVLEGHRIKLIPEKDRFKFTTGDMVWNKDKTGKELEWFTIEYDKKRNQLFMGSPDNPEWKQYLVHAEPGLDLFRNPGE